MKIQKNYKSRICVCVCQERDRKLFKRVRLSSSPQLVVADGYTCATLLWFNAEIARVPYPPVSPSMYRDAESLVVVSRDLAAIVYQWLRPRTYTLVRINIIISKSKAGPRPVSVLLSFSLPLPSHTPRGRARTPPLRRPLSLSVLVYFSRSLRWRDTRCSAR